MVQPLDPSKAKDGEDLGAPKALTRQIEQASTAPSPTVQNLLQLLRWETQPCRPKEPS